MTGQGDDYYARNITTHLDGTPIFATAEDERNQREVADKIEATWRCQVRPFGRLSPVDYYATRYGRLVGLLEVKARPHLSTKFATVFLNVRKYLALLLAENGLGCPAIFVVRFTDTVLWGRVSTLTIDSVEVAGCKAIVKAHSDVEPVALVRISDLKPVSNRA